MAKKKTDDTVCEVNDYLSKAQKDIVSKYGDGIFSDARLVLDRQKLIVSVGPALDVGLGGGIPEGCVAIISGKPKVGKSSTVLNVAANAQKMGKHVYYLDVEARLKTMNLLGIEGLSSDPKDFTHIKSEKGRILTAEEFLDIAHTLINTHPGCVIIIDSTSAMCASGEKDDDVKGQGRNNTPKLLANFFRKVSNTIAVNDIILLCIQHVIADTSGKGAGYIEDGGLKIQYAQDIKLRCEWTEKWDVGENQIGQIIHWKIATNALGALPSKVTSYLRYGVGIDTVTEWIDTGISLGLISKAGSWLEYDGNKCQGQEKMYTFLKDNPLVLEKLSYDCKQIMRG